MPLKSYIFGRSKNESFVSTWKTDNLIAGSSANNQIRLPFSNKAINVLVEWGDGTSDTITAFNQAQTTHTYSAIGTYTVKITGEFSFLFDNGVERQKILSLQNWGEYTCNISSHNFRGCSNLSMLAVVGSPQFLTGAVCTNMFFGCTGLTTVNGMNNWNVINVNNMSAMFRDCSSFNQNIGNWNVSNVTLMATMFSGATAFNQNIGSWNVSNVTNMQNMFAAATSFNQNIGSWNVSNVTNFIDFMSGKTNLNYSTANYDALLIGWSSRVAKPNVAILFGTIKRTVASDSAKLILQNSPNFWTITDGGY